MCMSKPLRTYRSAGGVVTDGAGRVLLIERTIKGVHEIRLPKGHIDPGETPEDAGLREVCEETGYCDLAIVQDLGWRVVSFETNRERVTRDERYYLMALRSERTQPPQFHNEKEALFRNRWANSFDDAAALLTFDQEQAVVRQAHEAARSLPCAVFANCA
jgi:8-oxo-dGTP pyrophosphatase MutT (NUDIX family)